MTGINVIDGSPSSIAKFIRERKEKGDEKMEKEQQEERLKEIVKIAYKLKWIYSQEESQHANLKPMPSYPLMQLSEVEKCMLAMVDDFELKRMREWYKDAVKK